MSVEAKELANRKREIPSPETWLKRNDQVVLLPKQFKKNIAEIRIPHRTQDEFYNLFIRFPTEKNRVDPHYIDISYTPPAIQASQNRYEIARATYHLDSGLLLGVRMGELFDGNTHDPMNTISYEIHEKKYKRVVHKNSHPPHQEAARFNDTSFVFSVQSEANIRKTLHAGLIIPDTLDDIIHSIRYNDYQTSQRIASDITNEPLLVSLSYLHTDERLLSLPENIPTDVFVSESFYDPYSARTIFIRGDLPATEEKAVEEPDRVLSVSFKL